MNEELAVAASGYVDAGLTVIALTGKAPNGRVHRHGLKEAIGQSSDVGRIEAAFGHPATTGVGILTNWPYLVVDIDGEEGAQAWRALVGIGADTSATWIARTSRGLHLWFSDISPRTSRPLAPKLDLKATGGYVAAPPSVHPSGHVYEWLRPPGEPVREAPDALINLLDDQDWQRGRRMIDKVARAHVRHTQFEDGKWWPTFGYEGLFKKIREEGEGNRNGLLYWASRVLTEDGAPAEDYDGLRDAGLAAGLPAAEVATAIASGRREGKRA